MSKPPADFRSRRGPPGRPPGDYSSRGPSRGPSRDKPNDRSAHAPQRGPELSSYPRPSVARESMLYGLHAVGAAWVNPERQCRHLYVTENALEALAPALADAKARGLKRPAPIAVPREAIDRMLPDGSVHQGIALDAEPLPEISLEDMLIASQDTPGPLVMLDQVTDPHNVGAILRSAAAFGAKGLIVQRRHAPDVTGVLAKAASGGVEIVPILRETNLARALESARAAGFFAVGLDEHTESTLGAVDLPARTLLALGAEGTGLRRLVAEGCDICVKLPTQPPLESLNVSNAAAIALYEMARRRIG